MGKKKKKIVKEKKSAAESTDIGKKIDNIVNTVTKDLTDKEKKMQKDAMRKIFIEGMSLREAMGFDDNMMDFFYSEAYKRYQSGKYKEANDRFKMLVNLDLTPRHVLGLAASFHKLKDFELAIPCYLLLSGLEPDSPIPYYHAADCYTQQNIPNVSLFMIRRAVEKCGDDPKYAALKQRCFVMMSKLEEDLGIEKGWGEREKSDLEEENLEEVAEDNRQP